MSATLLITVLPVLAWFKPVNASGTATLFVTPPSGSFAKGSTFDVAIHEDSGSDSVNAVQANLIYSAALDTISISSSPDFSIVAENTVGGGLIKIGRGTTTPVTGDHIVATLHIHAGQSGTGSLNFDTGSAVVRSTDNGAESLTKTGASYSISSSSTMSLSPVTKSVSQGSSFEVLIYEDSGTDPVNSVQANLSYSSTLSFVSSTGNTAAWPIEAQNTGSNGLVQIGRGTTNPVTGSQLVATVTFKAANAGSAQVAFASGSAIIKASDNTPEPSTNTGASYTITSVAPSTPGGGTASPPTSTKTSSPAPSIPKSYTASNPKASISIPSPVTTPASTVALEISNIKATNLSATSATISWLTSEPATSEVDYGLDTNFVLSTSDATLTTNHSLTLDPKELVGHKTYQFIVKSVDAAGNQASSQDMTFSTGGIQITKTQKEVAAGAVVVGAGVWATAAGAFKFGGVGAIAAHRTYKAPKPIIVGGGTPPPQPQPIVQPQLPAVQTQAQSAQKPTQLKAEDPQTPGEVIAPKQPPK